MSSTENNAAASNPAAPQGGGSGVTGSVPAGMSGGWPDSPQRPNGPGGNVGTSPASTSLPRHTQVFPAMGTDTPAAGTPVVGPSATPSPATANTRRAPSGPLSSGGHVTSTPSSGPTPTPRRDSWDPEPRRRASFLQRGLPKPLATLGQIGGLGAIMYFLWSGVVKVVSFAAAHLVGTGICLAVLVILVCIWFLIRRYQEQMEEAREEDEKRKEQALQELRDQGLDDATIATMMRLVDSPNRPSRRRTDSSRRSGPSRRSSSGSHS